MTVTSEPWSSQDPLAAGHLLVQLPLPVITALADGDLPTANSLSDHELIPYLIGPQCLHTWKRRRDQVTLNAEDAVWVTRLLIFTATGAVVGRAGFHGPPDANGMVEVGYSIDPAERRKGHAKAALRILLDAARKDERVKTVRATISPENLISRGLVEMEGFKEVGKQWDEIDGLETVLEVTVEGCDLSRKQK
jgi:RimJ/RimL family protein N-acetyltransferase